MGRGKLEHILLSEFSKSHLSSTLGVDHDRSVGSEKYEVNFTDSRGEKEPFGERGVGSTPCWVLCR